jgi:hypothetical protein
MTMRNQGLLKTFVAGGTIAPCRFIKFGADDRTVVQSAAAADFTFSVSDSLPIGTSTASGERVDVILTDIVTVEYGGSVTRGALLTSDADGKAITATASAGANVRIAGVAMVSGVSGDLGAVRLSPGSFQG